MPLLDTAALRRSHWFLLAALFALHGCARRPSVEPPSPAPVPAPASAGPNVRIGVVQSASSITLGSTASYVVTDRPTGRILAAGSNGAATVTFAASSTAPAYIVTLGSVTADVTGPVMVTSSSGFVTINGQRYRGYGEARVNSVGTLAGINELPLELYLYGVVPRELGPNVFPEIEGQKVQAIAARTYALSYLGRRAADGYDLRATTDDQVYGGYSAEHPVSNAAVDATAGMVLTHEGRLILARYSSTSGGHTADNEESFAEGPVAYMRGVPDMPASAGTEYVATIEAFKSSTYMTNLRLPAAPFDPDRPRYHRWMFEWSAAELSSIISTFAGRQVGRVHSMDVIERGPSGRIVSLEFATDSGSVAAARGGIRSALKYINAAGALVNLPSTLFFVEPVAGEDATPSAFCVYGGGFGHGAGMAQVGAVLIARQGRLHPDILKHYYQGAELTRAY